MINVRGIANAVTQGVNPNIAVTLKTSTGYTIDPATRRQVPAYSTTPGYGQLQALDGMDLRQLDGLNLQGSLRALYVYGPAAGVVRPDGKGGDVFTIDGKDWLVVKVLETWPTWCKVCINYQGAA